MDRAIYNLKFDAPGETVYDLAGSQGDVCFAACSSGLYRSIDGGCSWKLLRVSDEQVTTAVAVSPGFDRDRSVFAAVKGGILRSSDGGDTWFTTGFPAPPPVFSSLVVSPDFERDGVLLAGTLEDGVFSSSDRAVRWQPWNFGLFDLHVLCLAISPHWRDDETVFAGTETGLYRSSNGGRAWRVTDFPTDLAPILCLAYSSSEAAGDTKIFAGTEGNGLHVSCHTAENWQRLDARAIAPAVNQLQMVETAAGSCTLYALVDDGLCRSGDSGRTWQTVVRVKGTPTAMLVLDNAVLLGVQGNGILREQLP